MFQTLVKLFGRGPQMLDAYRTNMLMMDTLAGRNDGFFPAFRVCIPKVIKKNRVSGIAHAIYGSKAGKGGLCSGQV